MLGKNRYSEDNYDANSYGYNGNNYYDYDTGYESGYDQGDYNYSGQSYDNNYGYSNNYDGYTTDEYDYNSYYDNEYENLSGNGNGGKGRKLNVKRLLLLILCALLVVGGAGGGIWWYLNRDLSAVKVCESQTDYNKGIGLTFYVGEDGKTVEKIDKNDTVSLDFIKNNLGTENTEEIFAEYKKSMEDSFNQTTQKYQDKSWFSSNIESTDTYIKTVYTFDVSSKDFNYDDVQDMMKEFTLDYYYDADKKAFLFDESKYLDSSTPLGSIENVKCTSAKVEVKKEKK